MTNLPHRTQDGDTLTQRMPIPAQYPKAKGKKKSRHAHHEEH